ncbi:hypothetical protein [Candidatus Bandiella euplotis]|nr:hypothetical protein [Candidatus Bandiella woodruffii]
MVDIMHISEKEWNTLACIPEDELDRKGLDITDTPRKIPVNHMVALKDCFFLRPALKDKEYCDHWHADDCLTLAIQDYVLERKDIFDKIIAILERPCEYIPTTESLVEKGAKKSDNGIWDRARKKMHCEDKHKKPYTIALHVMNKHWERRFAILIKRKD